MSNILIIDDDDELRGLLADFTEAEGYSVRTAAILEREPVGILLLDLMLPGIDGFAACSAVRERRNIPIIMLSARSDEESKLTGYRLGADDYMDKPVSVPILLAKIKALLNRSGRTAESSPVKSRRRPCLWKRWTGNAAEKTVPDTVAL